MAAAVVGLIEGLPAVLHLPLALAAAAAAGALWGLIPALLKARFGAHEVITTIMLNYVVILLTGYLANYTFHPASEMMPATDYVAPSVTLSPLVTGSHLTVALFVGGICAVFLSLLLRRSVLGYEIRAVGLNPEAAEASGIDQGRVWAVAMMLGGALAGLGGAAEVLSVHQRFIEGFSPGYGFDGIAVALMGFKSPIGAVPAAILLGAIRAGALTMDRTTRIPADFVTVIQALMLLALSVPGLSRMILRMRRSPHL
jgi:simple sugar transport system permease protein